MYVEGKRYFREREIERERELKERREGINL